MAQPAMLEGTLAVPQMVKLYDPGISLLDI